MVSIGTVLTLGIIGAGVAGAYALYRSGGAIGGALSRGVEASLVNPIVDWANNLFKIPGVGAVGPGSTVPSNTTSDIIVQAGGIVPVPGFVDDPTKFNPPGVTGYGLPESPMGIPIPTPTPTPAPLPTPTPEPIVEKFYKLLTPSRQCFGTTCETPIPLGKPAIEYYASLGIIAHEVYI